LILSIQVSREQHSVVRMKATTTEFETYSLAILNSGQLRETDGVVSGYGCVR